MAVTTPSPGASSHPDHPAPAARLTRWSLIMVPAAAITVLLGAIVDGIGLRLLGLPMGELVLNGPAVGGWTVQIIETLVMVSAPTAGLVLAVMALRRGGRGPAWLGLALNGLLVGWVAYLLFDSIRMAYFPA